MTPAARIAAAIEILDSFLGEAPAEKILTTWGRNNRFAGSKDRAAIRDHVYDALRNLRSYAALGGAQTGRAIMIGALRAQGQDPARMFTGEGHAPAPLNSQEAEFTAQELPTDIALDCPEWLIKPLQDSLNEDFEPVLKALKQRAPVFLRVNLRKTTLQDAQNALQQEGIDTAPNALSPTALEVLTNPRRVQNSQAFKDGLVELQDAASQAVTDMVPLSDTDKVLDLCAGGGGKTLSMAGRVQANFFAYDIAPQRLRDLPVRAARAGVDVTVLSDPEQEAPYDVVLSDVPCSGSGAWRRNPEGKWRLTQAQLEDLCDTQAKILDRAATLVAPGGYLAYATCSLLTCENQDQIEAFQKRNPGWEHLVSRSLTPLDGGDGFHLTVLKRV